MKLIQIDISKAKGFDEILEQDEVPFIYYNSNLTLLVSCEDTMVDDFIDYCNDGDKKLTFKIVSTI